MNSLAKLALPSAGFSGLNAATSARSSFLRLPVLFVRAHFSSGENHGISGENARKAPRVFRDVHGLREIPDFGPQTLQALERREPVPTLVSYKVTEDDVRGPFVMIPNEALGEKFHINPLLLTRRNPGKDFSRLMRAS